MMICEYLVNRLYQTATYLLAVESHESCLLTSWYWNTVISTYHHAAVWIQ